jgi:hypothetical protein
MRFTGLLVSAEQAKRPRIAQDHHEGSRVSVVFVATIRGGPYPNLEI